MCHEADVCGTSTIFDGVCYTSKEAPLLQQFPDFEFVFQGADGSDASLFVPAKSYMVEQDGQFCWAQASYSGVNAVLGDVFMENFYIVSACTPLLAACVANHTTTHGLLCFRCMIVPTSALGSLP